jgi:hypothetical protein
MFRDNNNDFRIRIKSVEDVYHALTDKETFEKILEQGLREEYKQYKDNIVEFFMNMKGRIKPDSVTGLILALSISSHICFDKPY